MTLYPKVLVVLDPSVAEQKALNRAIELAKRQDCQLTAFLSIYDFSYEMTTMLSGEERESMRQAVIDDRKLWISELIAPYTSQGLSVDIQVVWHNRPFEAIVQAVLEKDYSLVIKGTHDHDVLKSMIFTPTDWHILRKCPCPVLLVNAYPGTPVNIAIEIPEFNPQEYNQTMKSHHLDAVEKLALEYQLAAAQTHVLEGMPEDVIPKIAQQLDAEMVVIGTIGRTGLSAAIIGNTAEHVIDRLDCDILAVKPAGFVCPLAKH
jgi:universal stress protein E